MPKNSEYRQDIQILRGLAVLAVVLFHAKKSYFPLGFLGVDFFFVISGFVVTPLILRIFTYQSNGRLSNLQYFFKRRFYRLAPALFVTLTISAMLIFLLGPISDHQRIARQGIATLFLVGNVGADKYSGDYFQPNPNPLIHTWSLSVEEQIYIFLPLILMLFLRNRNNLKKSTIFFLGVSSALSFVSFLFPTILGAIYYRIGIDSASQFSFYSAIDRFWQFSVGGLAFLVLDRYKNHISKFPRSFHFLAVIAVVMILFGPIHVSLKVSSILASFLAVIVIFFRSLDVLPNWLIQKLVWVGDRSYSIYLVHMPLLYLAKYSPALEFQNSENRMIQSVIAVFVTLLLGGLSYSKVENKYRNKGKIDHSSPKKLQVSLVVALLIPLGTLVGLDHSTTLGSKNAGVPVPNKTPPWSWDKDCDFFTSVPSAKFKPCKYGNHGSGKSILLIGDSHAASISSAIISLGELNFMNTYISTLAGCGFVLSNRDFKASYTYPYLNADCLQHNQSIRSYVKNSQPTVIIYMSRSSSVMVTPNNYESRIQYKEMVLKSLKVLIMEGAKVIHIGSTPEFLQVSRIQEALNLGINYSLIPFEDNEFWISNIVATHYLETLDIFCAGRICSNKSGRDWLFEDADHLSYTGENKLILKLDPLVKDILSNSA